MASPPPAGWPATRSSAWSGRRWPRCPRRTTAATSPCHGPCPDSRPGCTSSSPAIRPRSWARSAMSRRRPPGAAKARRSWWAISARASARARSARCGPSAPTVSSARCTWSSWTATPPRFPSPRRSSPGSPASRCTWRPSCRPAATWCSWSRCWSRSRPAATRRPATARRSACSRQPASGSCRRGSSWWWSPPCSPPHDGCNACATGSWRRVVSSRRPARTPAAAPCSPTRRTGATTTCRWTSPAGPIR